MKKYRVFLSGLAALLILFGLTISSASAENKREVAADEVPQGYSQDEQGRLFQTSFDLYRRYHIGVYDMLQFGDGSVMPDHSIVIDAGGVFDYYDRTSSSRHRHRFLEGRLMLAPFEIDARLYGYDFSRSAEEAPIWISTFIGEPRRFDVPIQLGFGGSLGRIHFRRGELGHLLLIDIAEAHLNWEFYQGPGLENYLLLSTGAGVGLRHPQGRDHLELYAFPEIGLKAALTPDRSGLTQIGLQGRLRWGWEPATSEVWTTGMASLSAERIIIAINDQPISLYLAPQVRFGEVENVGIEGVDFRVMAGARLSLFVPTRASQSEPLQ